MRRHATRLGTQQLIHSLLFPGWCFAEARLAELSKPPALNLDLGLLRTATTRKGLVDECAFGWREPPLLPEQFADAIRAKKFSDGKADRQLVTRLYADGLEARFARSTKLACLGFGWSDARHCPGSPGR